jgi:hypothetical protein
MDHLLFSAIIMAFSSVQMGEQGIPTPFHPSH